MQESKLGSFEELSVWQKAHNLVLDVYKLTENFPSVEQFRLTDQLCRSASSIPANIAEGKGKNTIKEYLQFLYNARGSLEETKYHLILARDLGYVGNHDFDEMADRYNETGRMLNGLINSLKSKVEG